MPAFDPERLPALLELLKFTFMFLGIFFIVRTFLVVPLLGYLDRKEAEKQKIKTQLSDLESEILSLRGKVNTHGVWFNNLHEKREKNGSDKV